MHTIYFFIDYLGHLDSHLQAMVASVGLWTYGILFLMIFCETGLVVLPFLPGDSLLFAAGTISAVTVLHIHYLVITFCLAAILGDATNYAIGRWFGPKIFHRRQSRWLNPDHLQHAHDFYERYGGKAIIIGRFVPIIRTVVPFVAGIGTMGYVRFGLYNAIGALLWVGVLSYAGFYFGNVSWVRQHLSTVILMIVCISIILPVIDYWRERQHRG